VIVRSQYYSNLNQSHFPDGHRSHPLCNFELCVYQLEHINFPNQLCPLSLISPAQETFCIYFIHTIISVFEFKKQSTKFWCKKSIHHLIPSIHSWKGIVHFQRCAKQLLWGYEIYFQSTLGPNVLELIWIRGYFILLEMVDLEPLSYCNTYPDHIPVFSWLGKPAETNYPYSPLKFIFNSDTSFIEGTLLVTKLEPIEPIHPFWFTVEAIIVPVLKEMSIEFENLSQCLSHCCIWGKFKLWLVTKQHFFTCLVP
jgi:hypothetical protein